MKMNLPKFDVVEHTALQFAMTFYDACKSSGLKSKYKTQRLWALHNYQKFLPKAIEYLIDMLARDDIHENLKEKIHEAIIERVNDHVIKQVFPSDALPEIDIKKLIDSNLPEKPTIVTDFFNDKRSAKDKLLTGVSYG